MDWTAKGAVTPAKDQGAHGYCGTFGAWPLLRANMLSALVMVCATSLRRSWWIALDGTRTNSRIFSLMASWTQPHILTTGLALTWTHQSRTIPAATTRVRRFLVVATASSQARLAQPQVRT